MNMSSLDGANVLVTVLVSGWSLGDADPRLDPFDFYVRKPFGPPDVQRVIDRATALRATRTGAAAGGSS